MDEREKRQAAQRELEELRKKYETKDEPTTSVFDDEGKFRNELLGKFEQTLLNEKLNMSQALAEREYGADVMAEKIEVFRELAATNQEFRNRFASAALPFHELVKIVDQHNEAKQMENIEEYRAKIRAEERAALLKEIELEKEGKDKKRNSLTPSLASKRSSGGVTDSTSEISLDDVMQD